MRKMRRENRLRSSLTRGATDGTNIVEARQARQGAAAQAGTQGRETFQDSRETKGQARRCEGHAPQDCREKERA